jgi:hypothetical protein
MRNLIAHGGSHETVTRLYAGYSWDEWLGFAIVVVGFLVVMVLIIRQKRGDRKSS